MLKAIVHVFICRCSSESYEKIIKSKMNPFFLDFKSGYLCFINILFNIVLLIKNVYNV